jgi:hypothetical protein
MAGTFAKPRAALRRGLTFARFIAAHNPETNGSLPLSYHDKESKTPSPNSVSVVVRPTA